MLQQFAEVVIVWRGVEAFLIAGWLKIEVESIANVPIDHLEPSTYGCPVGIPSV